MMNHKELADTGVRIPEIGVGTWHYKGGVEPLRRAISMGAFLIDTAEAYGTEEVVGEAVFGMRHEVFLATKVSRANLRYDDVLEAAENSLMRLGTDYIDLYQVHRPNASIPIGDTMAAMDRLVEEGKVRFIGVSNCECVAQFEDAETATNNKVVSNQVSFNLPGLNLRGRPVKGIELDVLPYCRENDVTVIAYSPLARGLDVLKTNMRDGALLEVAQEAGKTEAQIALNWCISKENVVAIPMDDGTHIEENCGASGWSLAPEQVEFLEDARWP